MSEVQGDCVNRTFVRRLDTPPCWNVPCLLRSVGQLQITTRHHRLKRVRCNQLLCGMFTVLLLFRHQTDSSDVAVQNMDLLVPGSGNFDIFKVCTLLFTPCASSIHTTNYTISPITKPITDYRLQHLPLQLQASSCQHRNFEANVPVTQ